MKVVFPLVLGAVTASTLATLDARILCNNDRRDAQFKALGPIHVSGRLLITGITPSDDHLRVGEPKMESEPSCDVTDQTYRD